MKKEGEIVTYSELLQIKNGENSEPLVDVLITAPEMLAQYEKLDMTAYTGDRIFVRKTVAQKLSIANTNLKTTYDLRLKIVYGYRHPAIQQKYFDVKRVKLAIENPTLSGEKLDEFTHNFVAVPSVAGHPTGGAVDITLIDGKGDTIDMGTHIADYTDPEKIKTFANGLSEQQIQNRRILHDALRAQEFAPFYGEWWHFSYGDKEWAFFYDHPSSLYSPIEFKI